MTNHERSLKWNDVVRTFGEVEGALTAIRDRDDVPEDIRTLATILVDEINEKIKMMIQELIY